MFNNAIDLLMYLDEGLVKNLSSLALSGYIDIRTKKIIQDRTLAGRTSVLNRQHSFDEDRCAEDEREGYKGTNLSKSEHNEQTCHNEAGLENREFIRREEEIKTIYTTFTLHSQLVSQLETGNMVKTFYDKTIKAGDVSAGEYIKMHGRLTSESVNSYLDSVLTIINCFGCETLNNLIKINNKSEIINIDIINSILSHLKEILDRNSTQDLLLRCGDTIVVLNVNNNFFMNNNSYIYDKIDCPCTVFGKVISVAEKGECISLLRKTAQHKYYEELLKKFEPYYKRLNSTGIMIPESPRLNCEAVSCVVVPISISM